MAFAQKSPDDSHFPLCKWVGFVAGLGASVVVLVALSSSLSISSLHTIPSDRPQTASIWSTRPVGKLPTYRPIPHVAGDAIMHGRPEMHLKASNDQSTTEESKSGNSALGYDIVIISALVTGLVLVVRSVLVQGGNDGFYGVLSFSLAAIASSLRPITSRSSRLDDSKEDITGKLPSIASLTAAEWRQRYEEDNRVSLWVEDSFNVSSRTIPTGTGTGEGKSQGGVPVHRVQMTDRDGKLWDLQVPEDRYILWEAEDQGMKLPFACRAGCCTTCAVKIDKGVMVQDQALGIAPEFRQQGYGLMCVGYPKSDIVMTLIEEDELYEKQFGEYFAKNATNPKAPTVKRDDFALEIALGDE